MVDVFLCQLSHTEMLMYFVPNTCLFDALLEQCVLSYVCQCRFFIDSENEEIDNHAF